MSDDPEVNVIGGDTSLSTNWVSFLIREIILYNFWIEILDCLEESSGQPSP
jgi:hypothetical protein